MTIEYRQERVDFHVHYDGRELPEIVEEAKAQGVIAMALIGRLDIDEGVISAVEYGRKIGVEVFPGVEYPVLAGGTLVDLVSIGFDPNHNWIRHFFGKEGRREENADIAHRQKHFLQSRGFVVEGEVEQDSVLLLRLLRGEISEKAIRFCEIVAKNSLNSGNLEITRRNNDALWVDTNQKYLGRPGYEEEWQLTAKFLWQLYFDFGKKGYFPIQKKPLEIVNAVHAAGGIALYSPEGKFDRNAWMYLCDAGIDGIMGWHGAKLEINRETIREAREREKLVLGGSDFHPRRNDWKIGSGNGFLYISPRRLFELKNYLGSGIF